MLIQVIDQRSVGGASAEEFRFGSIYMSQISLSGSSWQKRTGKNLEKFLYFQIIEKPEVKGVLVLQSMFYSTLKKKHKSSFS